MKKYLIGRIRELDQEKVITPDYEDKHKSESCSVEQDSFKEVVGDTRLCRIRKVDKEEVKNIKDKENLHYDINTNTTYYMKDVLYFIEDEMLKEYIDGLKEDKKDKESFNERICNYNKLPWYKKIFTETI